MTAGPRCPHCQTTVAPDWDWCHGCGFDPEGLRPANWVAQPALVGAAAATGGSRPAALPGRPAVPEATPQFSADTPWQTPRNTAYQPSKRGPGVVTVIVAVVLGLALIGGVAYVTLGRRVAKTIVATRAGSGAQDPVAVTAPDGTFTVGLSGPATTKDEPMSDGGTIHMFGWDGGANGEFVAYFDLPTAPPPDKVVPLLTGGIDTMVNGQGTSVPSTFAGHDALTFSSHGATAMTGVAFMDGARLYILAAAGPYSSAQPQAQQFVDSFHLSH